MAVTNSMDRGESQPRSKQFVTWAPRMGKKQMTHKKANGELG